MARKPRIDLDGFHHIVNRGVARSRVYRSDEDKQKFLEILCKACRDYKVNVHDYCLMDNHYHLLVETTTQNLSLFMRQINANYAIYFNKKYKRTGHLWQGRYRSWYVVNETYLYMLFRYIEHNPIQAKLSREIGTYPFTLLATVLNTKQEVIPCARHSKLIKEYHNAGIQELIGKPLSKKEQRALEAERKKPIVQQEHTFKQKKEIPLNKHFAHIQDTATRNNAILKAIDDGYTQGEIARYLGLSTAMISKIFRGVK
jgi:REP element-mobilizing transposase RayT